MAKDIEKWERLIDSVLDKLDAIEQRLESDIQEAYETYQQLKRELTTVRRARDGSEQQYVLYKYLTRNEAEALADLVSPLR